GTLSVRAQPTDWSTEGGVSLELALPARLLGVVLGSPRVQDELGHGAARAVAAAGPRSYLGLTFGYARPGIVAAYRGSSPAVAAEDPEGALREAQALVDAWAPGPSEPVRLWLEQNVLCTDGAPVALVQWVRRIAAAHGLDVR
ncbi:MAG: hypothetical protein HOO96_27600, partial [Polyangiaceae bacterium]|nr:hypothetical protein [Polyangiaceae bacterium]